jgi:hypothetical protein
MGKFMLKKRAGNQVHLDYVRRTPALGASPARDAATNGPALARMQPGQRA